MIFEVMILLLALNNMPKASRRLRDGRPQVKRGKSSNNQAPGSSNGQTQKMSDFIDHPGSVVCGLAN